MKIITRLTLKDISKDKKNFILCFISVLLSCILLFSVGLAISTIRQNQINNVIDLYGSHHAIIYNTTTNEKDKLNDERILKYSYIFKVENNLYSISDNFDLSFDLNGKLPTNNNQIIISSNKSYLDNLPIGSSLKIDNKEYEVVGIYNSFELQKLNLDNIVITKENELDSEAIYFIYLKSYKDIYNNIRDIANSLSNSSYSINNSLLYYYAGVDPNGDYSSNNDAVYFLLAMFLCLILAFIIFFIIYNAFSISVNEKKKKYTMYKSIGAAPKQILYSVFLESIIVLIIAIPLGFILSLGFISLILFIINSMLEGIATNIYTVSVYPIFVLVSLAFILVSTLLATLSVARMAGSINIIEEVRQTKKFKYKKENRLVKKLFGISGQISANSVKRDRAKYRITTISVVIGIVLFLTATSLLSIALYSYEDSYAVSNTVYLSYAESDLNNISTEYIFDYISNLDSVKDYVFYKSGYYNYQTVDNEIGNISIIYVDSKNYEKLKEKYQFDSAAIFNILDDNKKAFNQENITLTLTPTSSYANQESFDVTAKVINESGFLEDIYPGVFTTSIFPIMLLEQEKQIDNVTRVYIVSDDYLKLDQQMQELIENNERIYYLNYPAMYHEQVVSNNCVKLVIYIALGFIAFITVVSIIGTISSNLNLRRREFAILKSLGLSNKQFNKMIFYESLMLSLKSLLFGFLIFILIVSIFLRIAMISENTFDSLLDIPLNIFIPPFIICVIGVIVIVYLSFLIATKKIKKDNIVNVIKYY